MKTTNHIPVMLDESLEYLSPQANTWIIDATLGGGGHTKKLLETGAKVVAFEFDQNAANQARARFAQEIENEDLFVIHDNFAELQTRVERLQTKKQVGEIAGVLFDFGTSTDQLMSDSRGFSFQHPEADLDMRMDENLGVKAADLLKVMSEKQLTQVFQEFGGERKALTIAKTIVEVRKQDPSQLETVGGLIQSIQKKLGPQKGRLHPATKVFQALRIAVNDELTSIQKVLPQALEVLKKQGILVSIAFHEGEDRLVKTAFNTWELEGKGKKLTPKVVTPSESEVASNPRSRSAKLRAFQKQ